MSPTKRTMKAAAFSLFALASGVAAADDKSRPSECIAVDSSSTCAPFAAGHYINATYLGLVYGLDKPIPDAAYWDNLVKTVTSGSKEQAAMWTNWAQCTGYKGQPIQYYRSYVCLTDINYFSQGCNPGYKPPSKSICTNICESYGSAVSTLIQDEEICPTRFGDASTPASVYEEVRNRRNNALQGSKTCSALAAAWEKDGYKNNASDCQYGTEDDHTSCGFAGNAEIANYYCTDYPTDPCCKRLKGGRNVDSNSKPESNSNSNSTTSAGLDQSNAGTKAVAAAADVQNDISATAAAAATGSESFASKNKIPLAIGGSLVGIAAIAGAIVGTRHIKAKNSNGSHAPRPRGKMTAGTAVPFLAPDMKDTSKDRTAADGSTSTKHKVVYDYTPQLIDELELAKDDVVEVWASYDDGWGKGLNTRSGNKGTFPMACLEPISE
ncbi:uncharacterized protein EV422DRAFT_529431 [Fimicolochytrium jonesii]|uniref:uncharacterized protein n=1 Tax=Fimicolochytrium jonesii TaxID=1396493 RepID=UPI0022FE3C1C|nr:uncharacterized protein EV422DRAFT_529431 [Fimicolochytrium jonesii]KAI8821162.1 hypothetical protein EV422DRAFT_529431 [Fimicolochytrium jonesii]